ncbi:protein eva-1-like isoform X2 [Culicoides brevitarsis]|uniref:protein eva-1-like isoform X2 n=1 Tax=Culicoides brevitarsis TaxID=469753 RepID=UPI00307B789A
MDKYLHAKVLLVLILVIKKFGIHAGDNLALLSATLKTYQRAGCDNEYITLNCPRGTSISIELAQYGSEDNTNQHLCPAPTSAAPATNAISDVVHSGTQVEIKPPETCSWPQALQYSLLQTVVENCQKKRHCKFLALPKNFKGDPCPGKQKFVEIAYKCRPYEFRSKVACENDVIQLVCNPYSRVAIYSASFGRTEHESLQCSQSTGSREETCLASYATETVMQMCHGRRRCSLSADSTTFGRPCKEPLSPYLKVVYTCVPRKVLKDRYDSAPEPDEPQQIDLEQDQDDLYDDDQFYRENEAIPPAPKLSNKNKFSDISTVATLAGFDIIDRIKGDDNNLEENQEKFYWYLIAIVTATVLLCLILVIGRLIVQRRRETSDDTKAEPSNSGDTQLPNGFSDDISEIDADIDLQTSLPSGIHHNVNKHDQPTYPTYTPSPSPYGNLGPSNISHTSSTMLVPPPSMMSSHAPSIISGTTPMMMQSNLNAYGMNTIARHSTGPLHAQAMHPPQYMSGSIVGHMATLRRQPQALQPQIHQLQPQHHSLDESLPKSLSRGANPQYYYG